jgi:phasin family protein
MLQRTNSGVMLHRNIGSFSSTPGEIAAMIAQQSIPTFEELTAPVVALNQIALGYTEKLVEMNLSVLRKQADVALAGWREALSVKDAAQAKEYLSHQGEVARNVVNDYVADAKAVTQLNQEVAEDVRKVVEDSIAKVAKQAA